jgi:hypothetical protein
LDTFFIIIHKKKLIFLHWYHHITVLLYCWHSYVTTSPPGIFFCVMNYGVHSLMYCYYFLMALHCKPAWLPPMVITAAQISQMVVGVAVTLAGIYYSATQESCHMGMDNNVAALVMVRLFCGVLCCVWVGLPMLRACCAVCHLAHVAPSFTCWSVQYGSYLFLFAQFFVRRYLKINPRVAPAPEAAKKAA